VGATITGLVGDGNGHEARWCDLCALALDSGVSQELIALLVEDSRYLTDETAAAIREAEARATQTRTNLR
jgi:hypothetical protein